MSLGGGDWRVQSAISSARRRSRGWRDAAGGGRAGVATVAVTGALLGGGAGAAADAAATATLFTQRASVGRPWRLRMAAFTVSTSTLRRRPANAALSERSHTRLMTRGTPPLWRWTRAVAAHVNGRLPPS